MMSSYQYSDPHVKDKTVSRDRLIFKMGIPIHRRGGLYIERGPWTITIFAYKQPMCTPPTPMPRGDTIVIILCLQQEFVGMTSLPCYKSDVINFYMGSIY